MLLHLFPKCFDRRSESRILRKTTIKQSGQNKNKTRFKKNEDIVKTKETKDAKCKTQSISYIKYILLQKTKTINYNRIT